MTMLSDINRFRAAGVLPFGASAGDQDALFWAARDVVDKAFSDAREAMSPEGARGR